MTDSVIESTSLLAIDVGTVTTRAFLFDGVEGNYRLVAQGTAPTTLTHSIQDASEGIRFALDQLHEITGRVFMHVDTGIITPMDQEGNGVDAVVATLSAGEPIRVMAIGLLEDVSLKSAKNLLSTTYAHLMDTISMNDRRKLEERIDVILRANPNLVVIVGGTEGGASKSINKLVEALGLACFLMPDHQRPSVLYAGNSEIAAMIQNDLNGILSIEIAPNVRPDLENEQLLPAQNVLRDVYRNIRAQQHVPFNELANWSAGRLMPTTQGFARIVRFFSNYYPAGKGVLGIDLGAASTTVAAAFPGNLIHQVFPDLGIGPVLPKLLQHTSLKDISRWIRSKVSESDLQAYLYTKAAYPSSLPVTIEELEIEQALAREIMQAALRESKSRFPDNAGRPNARLMPWFEPVVASGGVITHAPNKAQSLLMLLDGLELTGITTVVLDQFNLVSSLGAAAELNPLMAVQVIDSGALVNLATVIAPVIQAKLGTPVLRVRFTYDSGEEKKLEVNYGNIEKIPLHPGQEVKLSVQPLNRADIGMGRIGLGGSLKVRGGELGLVIDARGRPLQLSSDSAKRKEMLAKWLKALEQ